MSRTTSPRSSSPPSSTEPSSPTAATRRTRVSRTVGRRRSLVSRCRIRAPSFLAVSRAACAWATALPRAPPTGLPGFALPSAGSLPAVAGNTVEEATESNNVRAYPVRITAPDLVVGSVTPEATQVVPGQFLGVGFIITNQGDGAVFTGEMWNDDLWFSTDAAWDSGDILLGGPWGRSGPFSPTASYDSNRKVSVPSVTPGTYYLIVRTDVSGQVGESDNTNNFRTAAIEVLSPDLTPDTLAVTGQLVQGRPFVCEITVNNAGQSPVPPGPWQDTLHLSSDPTLDGGDLQLGGPWNESGPLATGAGYTRSRSLNLPNVTAGTWYLIVTTDHGNDVAEADETNNIRAFAVTVRAVDLVPTAITAAAPLACA